MKTRSATRTGGDRFVRSRNVLAENGSGGARAGKASLCCGLSALAALWLGPLPAMSQTAFSPAMLLHLGVVTLAAPLIAFGLAGAAARSSFRAASLAWPLGASLLEAVLVWGWHVPAAHEAAARSQMFFTAQHSAI